jgi:probable rRNA maturation factor
LIGLELVPAAIPARLRAEFEIFIKTVPAIMTALKTVKPKPSAKPAPRQKMNVLVQLVTDAEIAKLNKIYRNKTGPTDVLSFCYAERGAKTFSHEPYGEIYISYPTAARQAREMRHTLAHELTVLAVHGALHVMGYDHEKSERGRLEMQKLETTALTKLFAQNAAGLITR